MKRIILLVIILWLSFGLVKKAHAQPYSVDIGLRTLPDSFELYLVPRMAFDGYVTQFSFHLGGMIGPYANFPIVFRSYPWLTWIPDTGFFGSSVFTFGFQERFQVSYGFEPISTSGSVWVQDQEIVVARIPRISQFVDLWFSFFDRYSAYVELNGVPSQITFLEGAISNDPVTPEDRSWYVFHHDQDNQLEVFFRQSNPQTATLEVLDLHGRTITRQEVLAGTGRTQISTLEYPSGIYLARLITAENGVEALRWRK